MSACRRGHVARASGRALLLAAIAATGLGLSVRDASAIPMAFDVVGNDDRGLRGTVTFAYNQAARRIDITVTNTTTVYEKAKITGFAFNLPGSVTGSGPLQATHDWKALVDRDAIDTPGQYGFFDIAALSGDSFQYGVASKGIGTGQKRSYSFTLTGNSLSRQEKARVRRSLPDCMVIE